MGMRSAWVSDVVRENPCGRSAIGMVLETRVGRWVPLVFEESLVGRVRGVLMYCVISGDFLCHSEMMDRYSMKGSPVAVSVGMVKELLEVESAPAISVSP